LEAIAHAFPIGRIGRGFNPNSADASCIKISQYAKHIVSGLRGIDWHGEPKQASAHEIL
jgi:hypothetical protein